MKLDQLRESLNYEYGDKEIKFAKTTDYYSDIEYFKPIIGMYSTEDTIVFVTEGDEQVL